MSVPYENIKDFVDNMSQDLFGKYLKAISERQKVEISVKQDPKKPETSSS